MIYNGIEEEWFDLNNKGCFATAIKSISNRGRLKRKNGVIEEIHLDQKVYHNGKYIRCYRLILQQFKQKSLEDEKLGRNVADHITHKPEGMLINDIRNLRWCTHLENCNFAEARHNKSISHKGKQSHKGIPHSDQTKIKISQAMKGKHYKIIEGKRVYF